MSDFDTLARSAADGNKEDFYNLLTLVIKPQLDLLNTATGNNMLAPTNSPQKPYSPPPPAAKLTVTGENGAFALTIDLPKLSVSAQIWNEVSYSAVKGFSSQVTTMAPTTATSIVIPAPGQTMFFRLRSSYDKANWNAYVLAQTMAVDAGLQSSAATGNAVVLNQSNYAIVDSQDNGFGSANIRVFGTSGPGFMYPAVKGATEKILPSATIVNIPFGANRVVAWDGEQYRVQPTLPQVFADGLTPTGAVSVVGAGGVVLPTLELVIDAGGHVLAWNVLTQGSGITGPLTLTIVTATGSGATPGTQTISGGKLISVAPGNAGDLYAPGDTITVSGGTFAGGTGGGQATGGNNGRFVYADDTTGGL